MRHRHALDARKDPSAATHNVPLPAGPGQRTRLIVLKCTMVHLMRVSVRRHSTSTQMLMASMVPVGLATGPRRTWQCDGCGGQNAGSRSIGTLQSPRSTRSSGHNFAKRSTLRRRADRVQVRIVHGGGSTTETISNLQCLNSDDIPSGHNPECTGPFRTRFEERDGKHQLSVGTFFRYVHDVTLASTSATSANDGHAGVQEIEVGYAAPPKTILNSLGVYFGCQKTKRSTIAAGGRLATPRGVTGGNPACTVTPRAYPPGFGGARQAPRRRRGQLRV